MSKKYINDIDLQVAMTEYQPGLDVNIRIKGQYDCPIGTVTQVYDNEHGDGDQVYVALYKE